MKTCLNNEKGQRDHVSKSTKQVVIPPWSNRTLHHPSFLPIYLGAGCSKYSWNIQNQAIPPIIPSEFFYTDPSMQCRRRIPNIVSELQTLECFRLNTPPPIMSACPAPPIQPDPFRAGHLPTRHLGSPTWRRDPCQRLQRPRPRAQRQAVIQLTLEEDQAITNLLKLHYQNNVETDSFEGVSKPESTIATDLSQSLMVRHNRTDPSLPRDMERTLQSPRHPLSNSLKTLSPLPKLRSDPETVAANTLLTLDEEGLSLNMLLDIGTWSQNDTQDHVIAAGKGSGNPQNLLLEDSGSACLVDNTIYPAYATGSRVGCYSTQEIQHYTAVKIDSFLGEKQSIAGNTGILLEGGCEKHWESELEDLMVLKKTNVTESEEVAVNALLDLGDKKKNHHC